MKARKTETRGANSRSRKPRASTRSRKAASPVATRPVETKPAFAYDERKPLIAETIKRAKRALTVSELFDELRTGADGMFATPRRVAATLRADRRSDSPMFENDGDTIAWRLRKPNRTRNGK